MKATTPTKAELRMQVAALQERMALLDVLAKGYLRPDHPLRVAMMKPVIIYPPQQRGA